MNEPAVEKPMILIADDDDRFRTRLVRAFVDRGYEARGARNADDAIALAQSESPEFAVVDLRMPGRSGLELVRGLLDVDPATRVVVLTGYGSIATAIDAIRLGAVHYLTKPADADDILRAFLRAELPSDRLPEAELEVPSLARVEWEHIQRVLADCAGNVSQAARMLGMHRRSLQRKLGKYPSSH